MQKCDVLVSSSVVETFGVTLIEALASGKPVVTTDSGGPSDIVNDDVGILVPQKDPEALADAIEYVLNHYEEYCAQKLSQYAKERYSYEAVGQQLSKIYRTLIARSDNT